MNFLQNLEKTEDMKFPMSEYSPIKAVSLLFTIHAMATYV